MIDNIEKIKELAKLLIDESEYYQALREDGYSEEVIWRKALEEAEEAIGSENEENKITKS
jgi:hypothetical protein